jgi:hypothetical protein
LGSYQANLCQTRRVGKSNDPDSFAGFIAVELSECRRRGIESLDHRSHNQVPLAVPELDQLADRYAATIGSGARNRIPKIKRLLRDGLAAWDNSDSAELLRQLFFGDSTGTVSRNAGELLRDAMASAGESDERRFRSQRHAAYRDFAEHLIEFVRLTALANVNSEPELDLDTAATGAAGPPGAERREALMGYVRQSERFIDLLAEAARVTVIGVTNENLASALQSALGKKRSLDGNLDVFWHSLRIVFVREQPLEFINFARPDTPDRAEALRQRQRGAGHGRRSVGEFLESFGPSRWSMYESPYVPPLIGTLFEMPSGRRVVHVLIRTAQRSAPDDLYLEFEDTVLQEFSATFEDVVHNSVDANKIIPVGVPDGKMFRCTGRRFRYGGRDESGASHWLPLVIVVTWRRRGAAAEPLLQLRNPGNANSELDRLAHLGHHILRDDLVESGITPREFGIDHSGPKLAALRRLNMEMTEDPPGELRPLTTGSFLHAGNEHLYFFIFGWEFPAEFRLPRRTEMHHVPIEEQLALRRNQTLRQAAALCRAPGMPPRVRAAAWQIASLNLTLDGHAELAQRIASQAGEREPQWDGVYRELSQLEQQSRQSTWTSAGQEIILKGLAGLQYREFYTMLMPLYDQIGVPGAAEYLARVEDDAEWQAAVTRLADLYQNEELMNSIPVEL